jgi:Txe/YoeB family toxin of Txe-Axe toxin-antitoxin module
VISRATRSFWDAYAELDAAQKRAARRAFALFLENPGHNSLKFKKLRGYTNYWSVRVSRDIRVVGKRRGDTVEWAWIGTHNEFDKLFG